MDIFNPTCKSLFPYSIQMIIKAGLQKNVQWWLVLKLCSTFGNGNCRYCCSDNIPDQIVKTMEFRRMIENVALVGTSLKNSSRKIGGKFSPFYQRATEVRLNEQSKPWPKLTNNSQTCKNHIICTNTAVKGALTKSQKSLFPETYLRLLIAFQDLPQHWAIANSGHFSNFMYWTFISILSCWVFRLFLWILKLNNVSEQIFQILHHST